MDAGNLALPHTAPIMATIAFRGAYASGTRFLVTIGCKNGFRV